MGNCPGTLWIMSTLQLRRTLSWGNLSIGRLKWFRTITAIQKLQKPESAAVAQTVLPVGQKIYLPSTCLSPLHFPKVQLADLDAGFCGHQKRFYRSGRSTRNVEQNQDQPQPQKPTPQLMDFPWVIWPSLWHTIRNWILSNLLIYRYLDQEFSLSSFRTGAIQALVHVSQELSKGNFDALEGLFTKPTLEEVRKNFSRFSLKQRLDLAVQEDDIFLSFPYQIGIIFTNEGSKNERIFVEITMCYHIFRGFQDYLKSKAEGTGSGAFKTVYENHDRISIANYRFIREFTKGVEDDWTITLANHFKPGDMGQNR